MSLPVCKFYSHNRNCRFGKNCRFSHSPPFKINQLNSEDNHGQAVSGQEHQPSPSLQVFCHSNVLENNHETSVKRTSNTDQTTQDSPLCEDLSQSHGNAGSSNILQKHFITAPRKICHHFLQHGRCAFGRNCRFEHSQSVSNMQTLHTRAIPPRFQRKDLESKSHSQDIDKGTDVSLAEGHDDREINKTHHPKTSDQRRPSPLCKYFMAGFCSNGRYCRFSHHNLPKVQEGKYDAGNGNDRGMEKPKAFVRPQQTRFRPYKPPVIPQIMEITDIDADGAQKYRQFDINYLQRRFKDWRSNKENVTTESDDFDINVNFSPSDPDWPFDVSSYNLQICLPKSYPKEIMVVTLPSDNQDLPESVRRYLEISVAEWLSQRAAKLLHNEKVELVVRPFFKWLDRSFEDLMTEALKQFKRELTAKAAGMEFIPATQLRAKYSSVSQSTESDETGSEDGSQFDSDDNSDECLDSDDESDSSSEEEEQRPSLSLDAERKGTEIKLRNLQLKQNASSLLMEKLCLIVQCSRCKNHSEVSATRGKVISLGCDKCSHEMLIQYRPALAHQFTSVVGYLDLDNCIAFDLVLPECSATVSCLACSKMTKINGLTSGQLIDGWCQACNARFKFALEAVKFYHLEPSSVDTGDKVDIKVVRSKKKPPKDPAIREGYPLPDFGACKHYKQSYRWLRFPCCGKAYPCDVCHDKKEDHEMITANRMICGHCSKEQNYSGSRPCNSCSEHMTKVHSSHWEGGSGCRDKIAMSRTDQQKYKNMNKTISNHKKKVQTGSKKKSTKLRHA